MLDPPSTRVDIEPPVADKSDQCHSILACEFDRKARRRTDGGHYGNAGHERFLNKLKTRTTADKQYSLRQWKFTVQKLPPYDLVQSVVPADVLTHDLKAAVGGKQSRRVQSAGLIKYGLSLTEARRHTVNHVTTDC